MNLLAKEAPLSQTLEKMREVFKKLNIDLEISSYKNPLKSCYSVNLKAKGAKNIFSNGKGSTKDEALASAMGEFIERLQTNGVFFDLYLPKRDYFNDVKLFNSNEGYLNEDLIAFYNQELKLEDLIDFSSDEIEKIATLPFRNFKSDEVVYFPINILNNLYLTNGLAAGNTPTEAQVQALSEIIERFVKFRVLKNGYSLPLYEDLSKFSDIYEDVEKLKSLGYEFLALDASLGGVYPVVATALIDPKRGTLFLSFGAHPIFEVALRRSFTEMFQGRDLDELKEFEMPTFNEELVSSSFNLESHFIDSNAAVHIGLISPKKSFDLKSWKYEGYSRKDELDFLLKCLNGHEIYMREYDYLGFYSVQMIVPNFSEIYPVSDLIYNNQNSGKKLRSLVLNHERVTKEELFDALLELDEMLLVDELIGVRFEKPFSVAELKASKLLQSGEFEEAKIYLELSGRVLAHLLVEMIEKENFQEYLNELSLIFSSKRVEEAVEILNQKRTFVQTTFCSSYMKTLEIFDALSVFSPREDKKLS
ncbi:MAG: YcaO-like family protein [Sulfurospirillaceae bacterium]|nr:YcaO-like family protein [Sulfurospirillaceae bacterium]MCK9546208.1 YcaO-like family protein [Sulfurospirillaceae bacterium]